MNLRITQNVTKNPPLSIRNTRLCRASRFECWWFYLLPEGTGRAGCSGLESPEELKSPSLGQSESYKDLGLISGPLWSLDKSCQSLLMFSELKVGFCTERRWESWHGWIVGRVDTENTWVADGGPDKGALGVASARRSAMKCMQELHLSVLQLGSIGKIHLFKATSNIVS